MGLLRVRGSAEFERVASGSTMQDLWLETEKWDLR